MAKTRSSPYFLPMIPLSSLSLLGFALGVAAAGGSQSACDNFRLDVPDVDLTKATYHHAGALVNITTPYSTITTTDLPAFCRAELVITTNSTGGSFALTEVWLPDDWNGRIVTFGNGGMSGGGTHERGICRRQVLT